MRSALYTKKSKADLAVLLLPVLIWITVYFPIAVILIYPKNNIVTTLIFMFSTFAIMIAITIFDAIKSGGEATKDVIESLKRVIRL